MIKKNNFKDIENTIGKRRRLLTSIKKETYSINTIIDHWNNSSTGTLIIVKRDIENLQRFLPQLQEEIDKGEF